VARMNMTSAHPDASLSAGTDPSAQDLRGIAGSLQ